MSYIILFFIFFTIFFFSLIYISVGGWNNLSQPIARVRFYILIIFNVILTFVISAGMYPTSSGLGYAVLGIINCVFWLAIGRQLIKVHKWAVYFTFFKIVIMLSLLYSLLCIIAGGIIDNHNSLWPALMGTFYSLLAISSLVFGFIIGCWRIKYRKELRNCSKPSGGILGFLSFRAFGFTFIIICIQGCLRFFNESRIYLLDIKWVYLSACLCYVFFILTFLKKWRFKQLWMILFGVCLIWQGYLAYRPISFHIEQMRLTNLINQAASVHTDGKRLRKLYDMRHPDIDLALAKNVNAPVDVLKQLKANSTDDIVHMRLANNSLFQELLNQKLKKGDKFILKESINVIGRTGWWEGGNFSCTLPKGTIMRVYDDQKEIYGDFWMVPDEYESMAVTLVPENVKRSPNYNGYYFIFKHEDIGAVLELKKN